MTTHTFNPRAMFPGFYTNPTIARLGQRTAWTISDNKKKPINFRALMTTGADWGARPDDGDTALVTLDTLTTMLPQATNAAFYLDTMIDRVAIIDVEPTANADTLAMICHAIAPYCLYMETSMSGKGYHFIVELPDNFFQHSAHITKPTLKSSDGTWEILLNHWVTFTRQPIDPTIWNTAINTTPSVSYTWSELFNHLIDQQPRTQKNHQHSATDIATDTHGTALTSWDIDDTTQRDQELNWVFYCVTRFNTHYHKTIDDFYDDYSRYEYSCIVTLRNYLTNLLKNHAAHDPTITLAVLTRVVYTSACEIIDHRDKHDTSRNTTIGSVPYLYYRTMSAMEDMTWPPPPTQIDLRSTPETHTSSARIRFS